MTILEAILPYLLVKKRRAQFVYAFCIIRELHFRRPYGDIERELKERMSELNKRGE